MARIVAADPADDDLVKMLRDLAKLAGVKTATKYFHALEKSYRRLVDHRRAGRRGRTSVPTFALRL